MKAIVYNEFISDERGCGFLCPECGGVFAAFPVGPCINCRLSHVPWKEGDKVRVKSKNMIGTVNYRYYNGYTLVDLGRKVTGGIFNNDSTFDNKDLELLK